MRRFLEISRENKSKKPSQRGTSTLSIALATNAVLSVATPTSTEAVSQSHPTAVPGKSTIDPFDMSMDLAITACNTVQGIGDLIPEPAATPIKVTFGLLTSVLETVKRCKGNREGWKSLADVIVEKNKRVEVLLQLYAKAPTMYPNALDQAMNYQKVLNIIISDIKKETEKPEETAEGLELYWSRMKAIGREVALSNINEGRITGYQDQLRTIQLDVTEEAVLRGAVVGVETHTVVEETYKLVKELKEQTKATAPTNLLKPRPRVVEGFIGREDILSAMRHTHFEDQTKHDGPVITVLTAMGGSGKTQIALKFASEFEEKYPDAPVYFLNASSAASLETDLKALLGSQAAKYDDALAWLATGASNWLLIMDNADDPSLQLSKYLPQSSHGHVIITTRNETHRRFAPRSTHVVDALPLEESITLLLRSSGCEDNDANRLLAKDIVEEVGRLPLAISHAAAYICVHGRLSAYLGMYRKSQVEFLNKQPDQAYGYPLSIAATIQLSYDCLSPKAQQLLQLFSYLDIQSIPRCIIERAAEQGFSHVAWETDLPLNNDTVEYANVLKGIFCPDGEWSDLKFDDMTEECLKYSLIKSTTDGEGYSMHSLVRAYLHSVPSSAPNPPFQKLVTRLLASSIIHDPDSSDFVFNRQLLPHIRLVAVGDVTEAGDNYGFGEVLKTFGDGLAITHLQHCLDKWREVLGDGNESTLEAMITLADAYQSLGQANDALPLQEEVLEKMKSLFGPDHQYTLGATSNLASNYLSLDRAADALPLEEEVLEKTKKLLGPDHADTLAAMQIMASIYLSVGREKDALPLLEEVSKKWKTLLGPDHLNTLTAMETLANTYGSVGREKDALPLLEEVVEKLKKLLGPDHLETIGAMSNLASIYQMLGRYQDALPLQEEVLEKYKKILGPDCRETVNAMCNLLPTYSSLDMNTQLEEMGRAAVPILEKLYGADDERTVAVKQGLEQVQG